MNKIFNSFRKIPRSVIAGWYGKSIFNFARNSETAFQSGCAISHSSQYCMRAPVASHPCCVLVARRDVPGERKCCQSTFHNMVVRGGGRRSVLKSLPRSQSFNEPGPLEWELQKCFSFFTSCFRLDRMTRTGWG